MMMVFELFNVVHIVLDRFESRIILDHSYKQGCKKSSTFLTPKFYDSNLPTFSGNTNPYFGSGMRVAWLGFIKGNRNMRQ